MNQREYEAKKALLKSIKREWGDRLASAVGRHGSKPLVSRLSYSQLVGEYTSAKHRLIHFIQSNA